VPNRFYMYGVIGRLAMLAAAYELQATAPHAEVNQSAPPPAAPAARHPSRGRCEWPGGAGSTAS
jgi:hypothetical protein